MSSLLKSNPTTSNDDFVERGQTTYKQRVASILEPLHMGEFVAVEPDSGQYFLGNTASAALVGAHAAMPKTTCSTSRTLAERPRTPSADMPQESLS